MLTPAGLADIRTYADGIGQWKPIIVPLKVVPFPATNPDGTPYVGKTSDATTQPPTSLIEDAHKARLFVHAYTFRNENRYLAADYRGDPHAEYLKFFRLGIDGVFSDFSNTAFAARTQSLGALTVEPGHFCSHHRIATAAAEAKRQANRIAGNSLFIDRRVGSCASATPVAGQASRPLP